MYVRHSWYRMKSRAGREGGDFLENGRDCFLLSNMLQSAGEFKTGAQSSMLFSGFICQGRRIEHILVNCVECNLQILNI